MRVYVCPIAGTPSCRRTRSSGRSTSRSTGSASRPRTHARTPDAGWSAGADLETLLRRGAARRTQLTPVDERWHRVRADLPAPASRRAHLLTLRGSARLQRDDFPGNTPRSMVTSRGGRRSHGLAFTPPSGGDLVAAVAALSLVAAGCSDDDGGETGATGGPIDGRRHGPGVRGHPRPSSSAPAGEVTFNVTNKGPEDVHEFVVFETDLAPDALPTVADGSVDEEGEGVELDRRDRGHRGG